MTPGWRLRGPVALVSLVAVVAAAPAAARSRSSSSDFGVRLRVAGTYGNVSYKSASVITNAATDISGNEFGGRLDGELWLGRWLGAFVTADYISGDLSSDTVTNFRGRPISQSAFAAGLALRALGDGTPQGSELALLVAPALVAFSDVRAYVNATFYDLVHVNVFGARAAARGRLAMADGWYGELEAYWISPLSISSPTDTTLEKASTHTAGFLATIGRSHNSGFGYGAGFFFERNKLSYQAKPGFAPQAVEFNASNPLIFLRFSF